MLKHVIEEMREKDPLKAKLAYHTLSDSPTLDDMVVFSVTLKHQHAWKSEGGTRPDTTDLLTNPCAGWIGYNQWDTVSTAVTWIMKWTSRGLSPVRPLVVLKHPIKLMPKHYHKMEPTAASVSS